ncbi:hypothetical protein [Streptomyces sp. Tue6028]|uniref:hypothetical protein n=1 Tax=Streptomyces sp. Tue6028 TaxID=2036037 RepID=UPI003D760D44
MQTEWVPSDQWKADVIRRFLDIHGGDWRKAEKHWHMTMLHILNQSAELALLPYREARRQAETHAIVLISTLTKVDKCWACAAESPSEPIPTTETPRIVYQSHRSLQEVFAELVA